MAEIGVIGAGTWGTTLAELLTGNGHKVVLWAFLPEEKEALETTRRHPNLGDAVLPEEL